MKTRTFTVLLTLTDEHIPEAGEIERAIAYHLETGAAMKGFPYSSAQVDVIPGDQLRINDATVAASNLHRHLRH